MKLSELRLSDFAHFTARQFGLQPGVNLLVGENRSGKTMVMRALYSAFANRLPEGLRSREGAPPAAVAVKLEAAGSSHLVERVFDGSAEQDAGALKGLPLALLLHAGFWSEGGLLALSQDELAALLRRLSLDAGETEHSPLPQLQNEYRRLTARDPWGTDGDQPGELEQVRERLAEIELLWEQRLDSLKLLGSLQAEAHAATAVPHAVAPQLLAELEEEAESPEPESKSPGPGTFIHEPPVAATLTVGDDDWPDFPSDDARESDPRKVRERLWAVQKEAAALRQELVSVPSLSPLLPSVLTLLFVLLSGALTLFHSDLWQAASLSGMALILCTWAVFAFLARNKGQELGRLRERLSAAEGERESLLQELDRLDEQRRYGSCEQADDEDPEESEAKAPAPEFPDNEVNAPDETMELSDPAPVAESAPKLSPWQQRRRLLSEVSDLRSLEMEGETLRFREQQLVTRLQVLATAIEMLLQAEEGFSGDRRGALSAEINSQLQALLPDGGLRSVLSPGWQLQLTRADEALSLSMLSRGEQTLVSLAMHLALLKISPSPSLPFFADDLFDDLQHDLRENALKVLGGFANTHQLVLAGRDPELSGRGVSLGWNIIALDESPRPPRKTKKPSTPERSEDEQQLHLL